MIEPIELVMPVEFRASVNGMRDLGIDLAESLRERIIELAGIRLGTRQDQYIEAVGEVVVFFKRGRIPPGGAIVAEIKLEGAFANALEQGQPEEDVEPLKLRRGRRLGGVAKERIHPGIEPADLFGEAAGYTGVAVRHLLSQAVRSRGQR